MDTSTSKLETESQPADETIQDTHLIIIPVREMVLFPGIVLPVVIGRQRSVTAAQEAVRDEMPVGFLLQKDPELEQPGPSDLYSIGTCCEILRYLTAPDASHHLVCQGEQRFKIVEFLDAKPYLTAKVEWLEERDIETLEVEAKTFNLKQLAVEALQLLPQTPAELIAAVQSTSSPSLLADLVSSYMDLKIEDKQAILETLNVEQRVEKVLDLLGHRVEVLRLSQKINEQTKDTMDERQKEYLLREKLRTIQQELGETDDKTAEIQELTDAIAKAEMPEEAEQQAKKELKRLERMPEGANEYSMVRSYLDWLIELPWSKMSKDNLDIEAAKTVLNQDHYGLKKVKRRILEHLAVHKLNPEGKSPILCFVGPPGVGKTSLGQSIARAMGREFVRASLGGVHDEAEIRGHRRTYIGALPGNVIQSIHKAGTRNPVFMLDEVDKLGGGGFHGDPSSALLEVLDPEQNDSFRDNYLGLPFDLSKVMFIATANVLDEIPGPLRDRMEVLHLSGYTEEEKLLIAKRYLLDRQLENHGLNADQCNISDTALLSIIRNYTREAGCRNLEREIGAVIRNIAMRIASGKVTSVKADAHVVRVILGPKQYENEVAMRTSVPGVATGLAWTPVGGDILFIEASRMGGSGKLILTGQLGDVMKESAQAALSLVKSRMISLGLDEELFDKSDIHVHVPAGAIPKDGPSAGVAMYIALVSLLTNKTVKKDTAMTGEISLRGLVLPVGGIKEKVLAALAAGIKTVLLPERNRKDYEDIPESAKRHLKFIWIAKVDEAVDAAIGGLH